VSPMVHKINGLNYIDVEGCFLSKNWRILYWTIVFIVYQWKSK